MEGEAIAAADEKGHFTVLAALLQLHVDENVAPKHKILKHGERNRSQCREWRVKPCFTITIYSTYNP
jgi:hypothetical protein